MRLHHAASRSRSPARPFTSRPGRPVRRDKEGRMAAAAMGRSEDRLVKRDGRWLIQARKLTVFTD